MKLLKDLTSCNVAKIIPNQIQCDLNYLTTSPKVKNCQQLATSDGYVNQKHSRAFNKGEFSLYDRV